MTAMLRFVPGGPALRRTVILSAIVGLRQGGLAPDRRLAGDWSPIFGPRYIGPTLTPWRAGTSWSTAPGRRRRSGVEQRGLLLRPPLRPDAHSGACRLSAVQDLRRRPDPRHGRRPA